MGPSGKGGTATAVSPRVLRDRSQAAYAVLLTATVAPKVSLRPHGRKLGQLAGLAQERRETWTCCSCTHRSLGASSRLLGTEALVQGKQQQQAGGRDEIREHVERGGLAVEQRGMVDGTTTLAGCDSGSSSGMIGAAPPTTRWEPPSASEDCAEPRRADSRSPTSYAHARFVAAIAIELYLRMTESASHQGVLGRGEAAHQRAVALFTKPLTAGWSRRVRCRGPSAPTFAHLQAHQASNAPNSFPKALTWRLSCSSRIKSAPRRSSPSHRVRWPVSRSHGPRLTASSVPLASAPPPAFPLLVFPLLAHLLPRDYSLHHIRPHSSAKRHLCSPVDGRQTPPATEEASCRPRDRSRRADLAVPAGADGFAPSDDAESPSAPGSRLL